MFFDKISRGNNIHSSNPKPVNDYYGKNKTNISIFENTYNISTPDSNPEQTPEIQNVQKSYTTEGDEVHSALLERIRNDAKDVMLSLKGESEIKKIQFLIKRGAYSIYKSNTTQLAFENIKKYIENSERIDKLQNAFTFLDILDNYKEENGKKEFLFQKDGLINLKELSTSDGILAAVLFSDNDNCLIDDKFFAWKDELKLDFDKEDLETILFAIYAKSQDDENAVSIPDGEIVREENSNKIKEMWTEGVLITRTVNGKLVYEDKRDEDGNGELIKIENGNKIVETWLVDEEGEEDRVKTTVNGELIYEVREVDGIVEVYNKDIKTGVVTIKKYKDGYQIIEN